MQPMSLWSVIGNIGYNAYQCAVLHNNLRLFSDKFIADPNGKIIGYDGIFKGIFHIADSYTVCLFLQ